MNMMVSISIIILKYLLPKMKLCSNVNMCIYLTIFLLSGVGGIYVLMVFTMAGI